jgi:hypothetical protein
MQRIVKARRGDVDLDLLDQVLLVQRIGELMVRLPMVSAALGHKTLRATAESYLHPEAHKEPEMAVAVEFVMDAFALGTACNDGSVQMVRKWYDKGSVEGFSRAATRGVARLAFCRKRDRAK